MNLLPWTIYLTFAGALLALVAGARSATAARIVALFTALAGFAVALLAAADFTPAASLQTLVNIPWISELGIHYHLAADGISLTGDTARQLKEFEKLGYGHLPVCIAKTQYSFSTDPTALGAPSGHIAEVRELRLRAGAGFVVALMGDIATMPGLPRTPAAETIRVVDGQIEGLF